jgi:sigma-B regulation protein RsbU (phosphoserine phosphatase)
MTDDTIPIRQKISELGALQEQLRAANHKIANLSALVEISKIINSTLDLDALLTMIMEIIKQVLNAESGSLLLIDESGSELLFRIALGPKEKELKEKVRLKLGQGIAGWVAAHGEPLKIPDVSRDKRFDPTTDETLGHKTRSILCVPLQVQGKTVGVLEAINSKNPGGFSDDDMDLFVAFSSQAAVAIESARMHTRLLEQQRFEHELQIAHQIQQNFLPSVFPKLAGAKIYAKTVPAWETGGDFFDVVDMGNGRIGAVIGDVSGKGAPAALYMVKALSEFRFRSPGALHIEKMLDALNESLLDHSTSGMFVTLLYVVVDTAARTLSYGNAGHLPLMRKTGGSGGIESLDGGAGIPLGIIRGARYAAHTVVLEKGDVLLLYTDGIIEARNRKGREFGLPRLRRLLSSSKATGPEALVKRILRSVERFSKGMPQHDDLTALAIRIG